MTLPSNFYKALYQHSDITRYQNNPFIEALPPILTSNQIKASLTGAIEFKPQDCYIDASRRVHIVSQLLDDYFQPIAYHLQLESKLSTMLRQGYVGRNINDGSLNMSIQNGYERIMSGELESFVFKQEKSTARSISLIGCSGSGKSTTLNRILSTYPQVIYHEKYNFTQISYLKLDCPYDGTLKNLCNSFFRAIDRILNTDYERKYALKRNGVPTLMALMAHIANLHAIGILVIDEIQHLNQAKFGGVDTMLNFFVTLVNVIGIPVVLIGTPKARPIFEMDLRSARRSAGFGALLWQPMQATVAKIDPVSGKLKKTEWMAFTDSLWRYQWLQKRDEALSDEIRACWYDLSQGVLDIVVKLFVLAQIRAIVTKTERITVKLLRKVYEDELKPVHPMLAALRSKDPELILRYSDLCVPDIDHKILQLNIQIDEHIDNSLTIKAQYDGSERAQRLHNLLLGMECTETLIIPLVERVFKEKPDLTVRELVPIVLNWYKNGKPLVETSPREKPTTKYVNMKEWHTLDSEDMRFQFSQLGKSDKAYDMYKKQGLVFDMDAWLKNAS